MGEPGCGRPTFIASAEMTDYITDLRETVDRAAEQLLEVSEEAAAVRPSPGRWSAKEVVGHLIDSAAHNHQRFVRAQWQERLVFAGYEQDAWVAAQRYGDAPWVELVVLWRASRPRPDAAFFP